VIAANEGEQVRVGGSARGDVDAAADPRAGGAAAAGRTARGPVVGDGAAENRNGGRVAGKLWNTPAPIDIDAPAEAVTTVAPGSSRATHSLIADQDGGADGSSSTVADRDSASQSGATVALVAALPTNGLVAGKGAIADNQRSRTGKRYRVDRAAVGRAHRFPGIAPGVVSAAPGDVFIKERIVNLSAASVGQRPADCDTEKAMAARFPGDLGPTAGLVASEGAVP
jgi:hypothetical protein